MITLSSVLSSSSMILMVMMMIMMIIVIVMILMMLMILIMISMIMMMTDSDVFFTSIIRRKICYGRLLMNSKEPIGKLLPIAYRVDPVVRAIVDGNMFFPKTKQPALFPKCAH